MPSKFRGLPASHSWA